MNTPATDGKSPVRVLAISGSLRAGSHNTALLREAVALAGPELAIELHDGLAGIPPFNEDHEHDPSVEVLAWREAIATADALLISTPEYNTSIPGQLKNAIDWASRPDGAGVLTGKPVAVLGASPSGYGAAWSRSAVCTVLEACGSRVVGEEFCVPRAYEAFDAAGRLLDADQRATLTALLGTLSGAGARAESVMSR